jgi:hypothetical protein
MIIGWTLLLQLALQAVLPVALLASLALRTPSSRAGFWAHTLVTALLVPTLALTGTWTLLPWWTPYLYAAALLVIGAALYGARALPSARWPTGHIGRMHLATSGLTATLAIALCGWALVGRVPADQAAIDLQFPLPAGDYQVLQGGSTRIVNANLARGGTAALGIDVVRLNAAGLRASLPASREPAHYFIHGTRVLAPCDGTVLDVQDTRTERPVPGDDTRRPLGNTLRLRCGDAVVTLGHLRERSVRVRPGDVVGIATPLAVVGNSGAPDEPVLHLHAHRGTVPLALRFNGRSLVRNDRVSVAPAPRAR